MGAYVNPPGQTKEQWLKTNGILAPAQFKWEDLDKGFLPVVLVDNGPFKAAGICFSKDEFEVFTRTDDYRSKILYLCLIEDLHTVSEELKHYLR